MFKIYEVALDGETVAEFKDVEVAKRFCRIEESNHEVVLNEVVYSLGNTEKTVVNYTMANFIVEYTSREWDKEKFMDYQDAVNAFIGAFKQYRRGLRAERPSIWQCFSNQGLYMDITEEVIEKEY